ncbi:hypothetical protein ACFLTZ_04305 [Chloroflexota bacterium]
MRLPKFYDWGGGGLPIDWSFGYLTGEDNDLVCVKQVRTKREGELALSPACHNKTLAVFAFCLKAILIRVDTNVTEVT